MVKGNPNGCGLHGYILVSLYTIYIDPYLFVCSQKNWHEFDGFIFMSCERHGHI